MIVEIAGLHQFLRPDVESRDAGAAFHGLGIGFAQAGIGIERGEGTVAALGEIRPDGRALFEVALEVDPPEHLGDELLGGAGGVH